MKKKDFFPLHLLKKLRTQKGKKFKFSNDYLVKIMCYLITLLNIKSYRQFFNCYYTKKQSE